MVSDGIALLEKMFGATVLAAQPATFLPPAIAFDVSEPLVVIGAGKAAAEMAAVVEATWRGHLSGLVVTPYGHATACRKVGVVESAHPVPDVNSVLAGERIAALADGLAPSTHVLCLFSGGGSAALLLPPPGVSLAEIQDLYRALLGSGANIREMNCVRRHLCLLKGGRLAKRLSQARVQSLFVSDVPGDHLSDIASGPTVPDATSCADALRIIDKYGLRISDVVRRGLESGAFESVKPSDPALAKATARCVMTPYLALQSAVRVANEAQVPTLFLGDQIEGEAREVGRVMAGLARSIQQRGTPMTPPCLLLSGGETTVTVRGDGEGGRNVEFLMGLLQALGPASGVYTLAADTDGVDGSQEVAGAYLRPDTYETAEVRGVSLSAHLARNDGHTFFRALGQQVITGPTRTNVNDFRAILVLPT